jgi:4-amino-4-deoxy-L-arabinose transferase-like glycosyltransferase
LTEVRRHRPLHPDLILLVALALGNALLLAPAGSAPRVVGALVLLLLPGLAWSKWLFPALDQLTRWIVGAGLSYTIATVLGLMLHYLSGPIPLWAELVALNALALIPILLAGGNPGEEQLRLGKTARWLVVIFLLAVAFRFAGLGYSEFQGDEALAMITAAEALEGHQDAFFLRGKGPGEALMPMALWRLTGTINEVIARLPFAIAGLLMVPTMYLLGYRLFSGESDQLGQQAGLIAAGLLALSGFMVGFSRIVQYQALVVWMSGLALLSAWEWRTSQSPHTGRWAGLTGAFLGAGLLAHYDAILIVPAIAYVLLSDIKIWITNLKPYILDLIIAIGCLLLVAGPFYIPYALDPQATRTGEYLGDRIGDTLLKNNLGGFLHFNVFYSSSYSVMFTGLLVLGYLAWELRRAPGVQHVPGGRYWVPALAVLITLGLILWPNALQVREVDLAALPFTLILLGAFLSSALDPGQRTAVAWLAVPFIGYNFAVALPLTHIYTVVPAWTLLAGLAAAKLLHLPGLQTRLGKLALATCCLLAVALFGGYTYVAFLRHDGELWQDWPESQPALYWSPYDDLPPAGFFGFVHQTGWKGVGALYAQDVLKGDYGSNEEPEVTTWYTRGAPRACDPQPEYYFIADDLVDPWPVDAEAIGADYAAIGTITLPNSKGLSIYQAHPSTGDLDDIAINTANRVFNRTATPTAFARSARGSQDVDANLDGLVQLIGYNIDTRRAWPGGRVPVTLYWQAQAPIPEDYHIFVHLEGDEESGSTPGIWGQADGRPVCWTYPTYDWRPGQIIADQHAIPVRPDTLPGDYPILVGMYLPDTGARLNVLDEAGNPVADFVRLTTVSIR